MATLKPKAKSKKPGRVNKADARNYDLSNLRQPIQTSISSFKEVVKLFEDATPEVKDLLTHEVNILYECRICRSIFRSLLNVVSHKRVFCKGKVKITPESKSRDDYNKSSNHTSEDLQSLEVDESTFEMLDKPTKNSRILRSQAPCKSQKKDLTSVVHMLQKKQKEDLGEQGKRNIAKIQTENDDCDQVILQVLESKRAAFQTLVQPNLSRVDFMENQIIELDSMNNQDTITLGADGLIEKSDSPVHFYSNEEETNKLICEICDRQFSTKKTLNSHMKILHAPTRVCYLCPLAPCTAETFSNPASVKRHLTNVHKKIGKELKDLGQRIEEKIVRTKVPILANKKTKKPENACNSSGKEAQEWMVRLDSEVFQDCTLCGEKFSCKADFMIHSENCIGQYDERSPKQIATLHEVLLDNDENVQENFGEPTSSEVCETQSMPIRVQKVSSLNLEDWEKLPQLSSENEERSNTVNPATISLSSAVTVTLKRPNRPEIVESRTLEAPQVVYTRVENSKKRKASSIIEVNGQISPGERLKKTNTESEIGNVPNRTSAQNLEAKIALISDSVKLECIPCKRNFNSLSSLQRHLESHIKLNRYRCSKCDYKSSNRNDCIGHCNRVHNAMNNRQVLNEMISTIPPDQLTISQEIDMSNLSVHDMSRSSTDADSRILRVTPVMNLLQKQDNKTINPSDTETETEDGESVRKLDLQPDLNEIMEIIGGSNSTSAARNSNINRETQSSVQNNNLEKSSGIVDYSPALGEIYCNTNYPDEEDEITSEFYPRSRSKTILESRSGSRMETRSSSRLGKKLNSDEEDEISPKSCQTRSRDSSRGSSRNSSRIRSESRTEFTMVTRSRSRLGNQSDSNFDEEENQEDSWKGYSKDLSTETKSRSRSRSEKDGKSTNRRSVSRQSRGKRRRRPQGRERKTRSISRRRKESSESFSSESSQILRPVRNRIKHVDKDFIYDLEDVPFQTELSYSPRSSSEKKPPSVNQFAQDRFISSHSATRRLFGNETDDLEFIRDIPSSSSDLENSELNFRGFPRQTQILNVE